MPVVVLLIVDGDHIPLISSKEVLGKIGATSPLHRAIAATPPIHSGIPAKLGVICGLTVTFIVAVDAHEPALGVKV